MPDYGVDTPEWRPLPWSWAAERLLAARNIWVVTVSGEGRPHAMPVWGVWDEGEHRFGFACGPRSRKARNLAANPQAVIMTESTVECLSVEGRAAPVTDDRRQRHWVERYLPKYQPLAPGLTADFVGDNVVVEFVPERAFAVIETEEEFSTRATRWVFP
jgi:nitroimidazol reductase NimA-like FMN-containing flavoprotein (pyridoxamine 5'-phosphate oxidase superfamily)